MASECLITLEDWLRHWRLSALEAAASGVTTTQPAYLGPDRRTAVERRIGQRRDDGSKGRRYRLCDRRQR